MEASGGHEQSWGAALPAAGIAVRGVDPKRGGECRDGLAGGPSRCGEIDTCTASQDGMR